MDEQRQMPRAERLPERIKAWRRGGDFAKLGAHDYAGPCLSDCRRYVRRKLRVFCRQMGVGTQRSRVRAACLEQARIRQIDIVAPLRCTEVGSKQWRGD